MSSPWRYAYNVMVIILSGLAVFVALALRRPSHAIRRGFPLTAAWIAGGVLSLRGVAGLLVDGTSDLVWWPTFLIGGILFSALAWSARTSGRTGSKPYAQ